MKYVNRLLAVVSGFCGGLLMVEYIWFGLMFTVAAFLLFAAAEAEDAS